MVQPRSEETKRVFDELIATTYVPMLKGAGFRKTRLNWRLPMDRMSAVIDVQRSWSDGDPIRFTTNWELYVPGYVPWYLTPLDELKEERPVKAEYSPLFGRIGDFCASRKDIWWMVEKGRLHPTMMRLDSNIQEPTQEISELLAKTIDFVLSFRGVDDVIEYIRHPVDTPHGAPGRSSIPDEKKRRKVLDGLAHLVGGTPKAGSSDRRHTGTRLEGGAGDDTGSDV